MISRRVLTWLLVAWTPLMVAWLALYKPSHPTCGPEIYRYCTIGLPVKPGLGRSGVLWLWSLGLVAIGGTWVTTRRQAPPEPELGPEPEAPRVTDVHHLLFVATPRGYEIRAGEGSAPTLGAELEIDSARLVVVKVGPSPLPGDSRRCAYLEPA